MSTSISSITQSEKLQTPKCSSRTYPKPIWLAILIKRYVQDYLEYKRTGETSYEACINLRRLFRLTNGRFNDFVARLDGFVHRAKPLPRCSSVIGDLSSNDIATIAAHLKKDGIHVFDNRLPVDLCHRLRQFAQSAPCRVESSRGVHEEFAVYDPDNLVGTRYKIDLQKLHENADIQRFATDTTLMRIAQSYFGCQPVFIGCQMWWSTAFSSEACSQAAQLYHFDMPQAKFLKIFAYLTDVDDNNGPHRFILGSHHRNPTALLEERRYQDEEILAHYGSDSVISLAGPTGTIFAEDTRGFHKGSPVRKGHRLILQLLYATSGFGETGKPIEINDRFSDDFFQLRKKYPHIYASRFRDTSKVREANRV